MGSIEHEESSYNAELALGFEFVKGQEAQGSHCGHRSGLLVPPKHVLARREGKRAIVGLAPAAAPF